MDRSRGRGARAGANPTRRRRGCGCGSGVGKSRGSFGPGSDFGATARSCAATARGPSSGGLRSSPRLTDSVPEARRADGVLDFLAQRDLQLSDSIDKIGVLLRQIRVPIFQRAHLLGKRAYLLGISLVLLDLVFLVDEG